MCQELGIWWLFCFEITYHAKTFEKSRQHFHPLETIGDVIVINILSYNGCVISETPTRCGAGACITAFTPTERHRPPLSLPRSSSEVASAWCRPRFLHSWVVRASLRWGAARHSKWRHGATLLASASTESSFPSRSHCRLRTSRFSPLSDGTVCLFLNSQLIFQHKDKPMSSLFNLDHKVRAQGFLLRVLALDKMKILRS